MKTRTVTVREGEFLGPDDRDYDHTQHNAVNADHARRGWETILKMNDDPEGWRYCPSGFSTFEVLHVGMWDGWPFWRPTPAIGYIGPLGSVEWAFFYNVQPHKVTQVKP